MCVCVRGCLSLWGVSVSGSLSLRGWLLQHLRGALCPSLCDCVCVGVVAISLRRGFVSVSLRVCLSDMSGRGDFYRLEGELTAGGVQTSPQPLSVSASLAGYPSYRASLGPIVGAQAPTLRLGRSGWDLGLPPRGGRRNDGDSEQGGYAWGMSHHVSVGSGEALLLALAGSHLPERGN